MYEPIYYTNTSLLIFTRERKLKRLKCPFKVKPINSSETFQEGAIYAVTRVFPSSEFKILYEIEAQNYPYNTFKILLPEDLPK